MSETNNIYDQVKEHVDCFDLLDYYGLYNGPKIETSIYCPFHDDTHKKSARVFLDGHIWCYGMCHKQFGPLDFVMYMEDISLPGAISWLERKYKFKLDPSGVQQKKEYKTQGIADELSARIQKTKGKIPFESYYKLWEMFDKGTLDDQKFNNIVFNKN